MQSASELKQREFEFTWDDFKKLRSLSNRYSGITVSDDKFDMFYSRLSRHVRRLGLDNFRAYTDMLLADKTKYEFTNFINAITTNLTSFFRENHHFDYLRDTVLPEILTKNTMTKRIRIWSAGCSTGEEPYSIAMTVLENIPTGWDAKILATDLDTHVLSSASAGVFKEDRISGLSDLRKIRWFKQGQGMQSDYARVASDLQQIIRFNQLNLMGNWPMKGPFDAIFCRNVLIYFDKDTKTRLADRFADILADKSTLFIGHSESIYRLSDRFKLIGNTIYRKP